MEGAVFVQTNAAHNEVIAFSRAADGSLAREGESATGGAGNDEPHLPSQGSVTLTRDRRHLLVTNVASNDVSVFAVNGAMLELTKTVPVGMAPRSVAEHDGLVFVLNTGDATITGFRLVDSDLVPIEGATRSLSTPDGAQVGFTPDGRALVVTERGGDKTLLRRRDGRHARRVHDRLARRHAVRLRDLERGHAHRDGGVPCREGRRCGLELPCRRRRDHAGHSEHRQRPKGDLLGCHHERRPIRVHHELRRWGRLSLRDRHGRRDHPRGRDRRDHRGRRPGLRDEDLSDDGRYLYAIDADQGQVVAWSVDGRGQLSAAGSWGGLPTTIAGLAAR